MLYIIRKAQLFLRKRLILGFFCMILDTLEFYDHPLYILNLCGSADMKIPGLLRFSVTKILRGQSKIYEILHRELKKEKEI